MSSSFTVTSPLTRQLTDAIDEACVDLELEPVDLTHGAFVRWLKEEKKLGVEKMRDLRLHLQRIGGFQNLRNGVFPSGPSAALIENEELRANAKVNKPNAVALAHDEVFFIRLNEIMAKVSGELAKKPIPTIGSISHKAGTPKRITTLLLSDLHFGSSLDPRDVPFRYDYEEESRALASIMVRLCEFKIDHREESELVIWLGGDIISGKIHDKQVGRASAEQFCDAQWLLIQAVRLAAKHWKKVSVHCSTGNHDRDETRHNDRAMDAKWDSNATKIYFGLKTAVDHLDNVSVSIPRTPYCDVDLLGHPAYFSHGDTNLNVGNPSSIVSIGKINNQMNAINLARVKGGLKPYEIFGVGHVHQGLHLPLPAGDLIINPALTPVNGYAESVGYPMTRSGQTLFETTKEYAVGDLRFLDVQPEILKDKSLDKIILPFRDF